MATIATKEESHQPKDSLYVPSMGKIVATNKMTATEKHFQIALEAGGPLGHSPGQFVQILVPGYGECPISICSSPTQGETFELCVRAAGTVTNAVHQLDAGDKIGIRGPFGKGFNTEVTKSKNMLFVAGGLGLAPMRSFINYVLDKRSDYGDVTIMVGARSPDELLFKDDLAAWEKRDDVECQVTVDRGGEGWKGRVGLVTSLFDDFKVDPMTTWSVIVGPPIMFKFTVLEVLSLGIPENRIFCSLERHMKCGLGKCGHCQIGKVYVCQDGPVFTYEQVRRLREGI